MGKERSSSPFSFPSSSYHHIALLEWSLSYDHCPYLSLTYILTRGSRGGQSVQLSHQMAIACLLAALLVTFFNLLFLFLVIRRLS